MTDDYDPYQAAIDAHDAEIFGVGTSPRGKQAVLSVEHCRDGLREAGARVELAGVLRADSMLDLADWIHAARAHGISKRQIAHLGRVSRATVYAVLDRGDQAREVAQAE